MHMPQGELHINGYHAIADCDILPGQALTETPDERHGIYYTFSDLGGNESCTHVAIDVSGCPFPVWQVAFLNMKINAFYAELVRKFFQTFAQNTGIMLHIISHYGANSRHTAGICASGRPHECCTLPLKPVSGRGCYLFY